MSNILNIWRKLWQDNKFLKILSVFIALIIWIIIITVASPVNEKSFYKVPVDISFEGSVPDRNGLMMIMSDTNVTINVDVSGNRSSLVSVRTEDIRASLNFDSVTTEGIYSVPITVSVDNAGVTVKDISPNDQIIIQFVRVSTRELPVQIEYTTSYPTGYGEASHDILPSSVTVTGPSDTVALIDRAVVRINPSAYVDDFSEACDVHLLDAEGNNIDRKNLTVSSENVTVSVSVAYTATLPLEVSLKNTYGGKESYASVTFSRNAVTLTGNDSALKKLNSILLGEIKLENHKNGDTFTFTLPAVNGAEYVGAKVGDTVTATLNLPNTGKYTYSFSANELTTSGLLSGYTFEEPLSVTLRMQASVAEQINLNDISLSAKLISGNKARITVSLPSGVAYGVMEEYDVTVAKR